MRQLIRPLARVALPLFVVCGPFACSHGSPASPSAASPASSTAAAPSPVHLRVVTWNLQHGYSADRRHVNAEQIAFLASLQPDVVALQEVAEWDNDMPTIYHQGLEAATGRRWTWRYEADVPSLPASRRDGSAIASSLGVQGQDVLHLDDPSAPTDSNRNRTGLRLSIAAAGGVRVDVATTHLDYLDAANRRSQVDRLQAWLAGGAAVRIVAGDFNAEPDDPLTWSGWRVEYSDAWLSSANPLRLSPGFTMPLRSTTGKPGRIDYQWFRGAVPSHVEVVQTTLSDHYALVADYTLSGR